MKTKRVWSMLLALVGLFAALACMSPTVNAKPVTTEITPENTSGTMTITLTVPEPASDPVTAIDEGFEGGVIPVGWTQESSVGSYLWRVGIGDHHSGTGTHSGAKNASIIHVNRGESAYLVSPMFDMSDVDSGVLSFWYINRYWSGDIDGFGVYYRVNNGSWVSLFNTSAKHGHWTEQEVELPAEACVANVQLGFKAVDNYGYGVGLDDISLKVVTDNAYMLTYDANGGSGDMVQRKLAGGFLTTVAENGFERP